MSDTIDSLQIQIQADARSADKSIASLAAQLTKLKTALTGMNTVGLSSLASSMNTFSRAMSTMKGVSMPDFNRTAKGIERLGAVNTASIQNVATSVRQLANSLAGIQGLSSTASSLSTFSSAMSKMGGKSAVNAVTNIPKLGQAFRELMTTLSKAPTVSRNVIELANAMAKVAANGNYVSSGAKKGATGLNLFSASAYKASSASTSLASTIGKIYATYWLLFRAFSKLGDAIDISSSTTELSNVVNMTFGDMAYKVDDFTQDSIQKFGMAELAVKTYAGRFQSMGVAMGISSKQVAAANEFLTKNAVEGYVEMSDSMADVSLNLTKLTADIASFYDADQATVAESLASGVFAGNSRVLRKYGLDLTQATLAEWAMKNGLDADVASMTQAQKTMLRYQYVLAQTTQLQGDFQRTSDRRCVA